MAPWQVIVLAWLGLVVLLGIAFLVAERREWINDERLRSAVRKAYRRHDDGAR